MISDDERREVARRLREDPERVGVDYMTDGELLDVIAADVGVRSSCGDFDAKLMDKLADLIDRPKAKREDAGNYWLCGHCGAFSRKDAVTDCCGVIPSRRCGNCGREWER